MIVEGIREKVEANQFEFSKHALDQAILRKIPIVEIREAISTCELNEDYPDDKYGQSCLILGSTSKQRPLHIQCSCPSRPVIKIITTYEPNRFEWIEYRTRRYEAE